MNERSKGVTIFGWFLIVTSITGVIGNIYILIAPPAFMAEYSSQFYRFDPDLIREISSVISMVLNGFSFLVGLNILRLRERWRQIAIYYLLFQICYSSIFALVLLRDPTKSTGAVLGSGIINILLIYFLTRPNVRDQFETA